MCDFVFFSTFLLVNLHFYMQIEHFKQQIKQNQRRLLQSPKYELINDGSLEKLLETTKTFLKNIG